MEAESVLGENNGAESTAHEPDITITTHSTSEEFCIPLPGETCGVRMYRKFSRTISVERRSTKQKVVHEITAGGVALNSLCEAAVIQRRNLVTDELQWCLPKGHLENGETKIDAAIREIFEETGIIAKPIHKIGHFDYYFSGGNFLIHKTVHHYLMRAVGGFLTVENDPDEEAESAYYVPIKDLRSLLTYKNEKFIIDKVMREIEGRGVTAILGGES